MRAIRSCLELRHLEVLLLSCSLTIPFGSTGVFAESRTCDYQNTILTEYFWKAWITKKVGQDVFGRPVFEVDPAYVASAVEASVRHYLLDLSEEMHQLRSTFKEVKRIRDQVADSSPDTPSSKRLLTEFRRRLDELGDRADSVRDKLSYPLFQLKSKEEFRYSVSDSRSQDLFEDEIAFMEDQIARVVLAVNNLFCSANHVVSVETLGSENLLINLYRVKKISEAMEKAI